MSTTSGYVYNKRTQRPIPFIGVKIGNKTAITDNKGFFSIDKQAFPTTLLIQSPFFQPITQHLAKPVQNMKIFLMPARVL